MPEKCPYCPNFKCPYDGIIFCTSLCFDCYIGELSKYNSNIGINVKSGEVK